MKLVFGILMFGHCDLTEQEQSKSGGAKANWFTSLLAVSGLIGNWFWSQRRPSDALMAAWWQWPWGGDELHKQNKSHEPAPKISKKPVSSSIGCRLNPALLRLAFVDNAAQKKKKHKSTNIDRKGSLSQVIGLFFCGCADG